MRRLSIRYHAEEALGVEVENRPSVGGETVRLILVGWRSTVVRRHRIGL